MASTSTQYPPFPAPIADQTNGLRVSREWLIFFQQLAAQGSAGAGAVTGSGLTNNVLVLGAGASAIKTLGSAGTTTTVLHGNAAGAPSFGAVVEDDQSLSDVTTWDVATTRHGYAPKLPNDATKFLDGTGHYTTPSGSVLLQGTTTVLTDAQIKALPTTGGGFTSLVAAPGVGVRIVPVLVDVKLDTSGGAYTNISSDGYWTVVIENELVQTNSLANDSTIPITYLSNVLGAAGSWQATLTPYSLVEPLNAWGNTAAAVALTGAGALNKALGLFVSNGGSGDYTGGNAANALTLTPYYTLVNY